MKTTYITTPIYYASGNVHIGNSYSTIACDTFNRYKKLCGNDTYYLTGMDEHGQKIENKAKSLKIKPQTLVDEVALKTKELWKNLKITNDDFIRTSEERHIKVVQKVFEQLLASNDIYLSTYEGDYCVDDEAFFTKTQMKEEGICPDCGRKTIKVKEESYFLNLKKYEKQLLDFIQSHPDFIQPESRRNEVVSFVKGGLEDLCVSRTSFKWGIPVLSNPKHVVYVWIDALTNYISALGYDSDDDRLYQKYWVNGDEVYHVVGKDILRFHAVYWPIMLMALGVPIKFKLLVHGWLLTKDSKMSKSLNNVVYPMDIVNEYGLDALRYYLIKEMPLGNDANFTYERFLERYNVDLANDLGNLVSRTISMINKYDSGYIYKSEEDDTIDCDLKAWANTTIEEYNKNFDHFLLQNGVIAVWNFVGRVNKYIDEKAPWVLAKDPSKKKTLSNCLYNLYESIRLIAIMASPVIVNASMIILEELGLDASQLANENLVFGLVKENKVTDKPVILFKRLDIVEEMKKHK